MRKLYLVAYDESFKRDELTSYLETADGCGPWFYSIPSSIFLFSRMTAKELCNVIRAAFPSHGRCFVTEVPLRNAEGWIPGSHWDLIRENDVVHDYDLDFRGYWVDGQESVLPAVSGVYCVYACVRVPSKSTVVLKKLLYIGRSENVRERHMDHESKSKWLRQLQAGESLCYSVAELASQRLEICEAAMIFEHHPVCNDAGTQSFSHGATHVKTKGQNALLANDFVVR